MKIASQIITKMSGSIGGLTGAHNKGGLYFRARAVPTNPNTTFQQAVRASVSQLTSLWVTLLTEAQRAAWTTYGLNVPLLDTLGEPRISPGLSHYVRSNVPRIQAQLPRVDDAPTIFNLGAYTEPILGVVDGTAGTGSLAFTDTDDWANEDDAGMIVSFSRGTNPSINYFKGPYRFTDSIDGDAVTPPTSPNVFTLPFPVSAGQRCFMFLRVSRADGRLSSAFRDFQLVT